MRGAGRLAPTPSGDLHLGNVVAFTAAWLSARANDGRVLLRIEDIDRSRARRHVEDRQKEDLRWLGLHWDEEVLPQRDRRYEGVLNLLQAHTYFCACSRSTLKALGGHPIDCRDRKSTQGAVRYRLEPGERGFVDRVHGRRDVVPLDFGDPVLRRRDGVFTYNLAVVADDILDGVTEVVRGADLLDFTAVQVDLWTALGATPPTWLHAPLMLDPDGRKLAKSLGATGVRELREAGVAPETVLARVLQWLGQPMSTLDPSRFDPSRIPRDPILLTEKASTTF